MTTQEVDEVMSRMSMTDRLQDFPLPTSGVPMLHGTSDSFFHNELPYQHIKEVVLKEKELLFACFDNGEA